jgi:endo-1,4-beta-xylanase
MRSSKTKLCHLSCIILAATLLLSLAACKKTETPTTASVGVTESVPTETVTEVIKFAENGFEQESDLAGWIGRSNGDNIAVSRSDAAAHSGSFSLLTVGRNESWNGPGYPFLFVGGSSYSISVWVYQESGEPQTMVLSAEVTIDGVAGYQNVNRMQCESGVWTELKGDFRAGTNSEKNVIFIETLNVPEMDFYIDDIVIIEKESVGLVADLPSLSETYKDEFSIGCAIPFSAFTDEELMNFLGNQYNTFTPENEMKPENLLDLEASRTLAVAGDETHPVLNFEEAKPLLDFAKENGFTVNGHVLVWFKQTPAAFFNEGYLADAPLASREVMLARLENYIAGIFEFVNANYPGVIMSWDVVNEAISDTGELRMSVAEDGVEGCLWVDTIGADYVVQAFTFARKYAPDDVKLFYNDYSVPYEPKQTGIYNLVAELVEKDLIDGIGFQGHYQMSSPAVSQITAAFDRFAALGLSIRVTELDIEATGNSEEEMLNQAYRYADLMAAFQEYSDIIDAVVFWGISDATSWKADKYPLLFDAEMQPKYSFWALTDPTKVPEKTNFANAYGKSEANDENYSKATEYEFGDHSFKALYDDSGVYVRVFVADATVDASDSVTIFTSEEPVIVSRETGTPIDGGYILNFQLPVVGKSGDTLVFDILVLDNGVAVAWNDRKNEGNDRKMGKLTLKTMAEMATAVYGKPDMSGVAIDPAWDSVPSFNVEKTALADATENGTVKIVYKAMWQEDMLYVLAEVTDPYLDDSSLTSYEQDSVEVFLDEGNHKKGTYEADDGQYRLNFNNVLSIDHGGVTPVTRTMITDGGFTAEFAIPLSSVGEAGKVMGFDLRYNNIDSNGNRKLINFWDTSDTGWQDTAVFGLIKLQ